METRLLLEIPVEVGAAHFVIESLRQVGIRVPGIEEVEEGWTLHPQVPGGIILAPMRGFEGRIEDFISEHFFGDNSEFNYSQWNVSSPEPLIALQALKDAKGDPDARREVIREIEARLADVMVVIPLPAELP